MRQLLLFIITLLFLTSCAKKDEVQFILLNDNLVYHVNQDSLNYFKSEFENQKDKDLSGNIIKFKIKNTTDKKYLFLVKDIFLKNLVNIHIQVFENDSFGLPEVPFVEISPEETQVQKDIGTNMMPPVPPSNPMMKFVVFSIIFVALAVKWCMKFSIKMNCAPIMI